LLRGIGKLHLRYDASNWYAYEPGDAIMVNRHDFVLPLVQHYVLKGSGASSRKLNELFVYWIDNFDETQLRRADTPIDAAIRLINWLWVLNSEVLKLDQATAARLAAIIYIQVEYIYSRFSAGGNHLVLESLAVFVYGCIFESTPAGARWKKWGGDTLRNELRRQTTEDGVHTEQSMFYHQAVATHFLKFFLASAAFDVPIDPVTRERFGLMLDYVHATAMPDLTHPVVGDGEALVTEDREHWEARSLLAARWVLFEKPVDASLCSMIDDSSIWLLARAKSEIGTAEDTLTSVLYRGSGLAVFRASNAYAFIDAAPFSDPEFPHHGHADALSFVTCAGSDQLLVDPGGYGYYEDEFRRFFRSTAAHNTVMLDGRDQSQLFGVLGYGRLARARIEDALLSDDADCILASHDGYRPLEHLRGFFFCKRPRPVLVILDNITGPGSNRAISRFHAAPGVRINIEKNQIVTNSRRSTYHFATVSTVPMERRVVCGQQDGSVQGWVSPETRGTVPADTLELAFGTGRDSWVAAAFVLQSEISIAMTMEETGAVTVSIGEHAYSLGFADHRISVRAL
jgi:hypothetical protein